MQINISITQCVFKFKSVLLYFFTETIFTNEFLFLLVTVMTSLLFLFNEYNLAAAFGSKNLL